jgi:hypothetical protein
MASLAERLRSPGTREAALRTMEAAPPLRAGGPVDTTAVEALSDLRLLDVEEVPRDMFERVSLLLGRLCLETAEDQDMSVPAAIFGDGRLARFLDVRQPLLHLVSITSAPHSVRHRVCSRSAMPSL